MNKPSMLTPALIGGVALGAASGLPIIGLINCACCALIIGGGVLAVYLYSNDYPAELGPVSYGDGMLIGALAGLIGGAVETVITTTIQFAGLTAIDMNELIQMAEQMGVDVPPQIASQMAAATVLGIGAFIVSLFFNMLFGAVFACLGGVIGVALFAGRRLPPAPAANRPAPPPPSTPIASSKPQEPPAAEPEPSVDAGPADSEKEE